MASCIRNTCSKNYQNLITGFQVSVKNVRDVFLKHSVVQVQCSSSSSSTLLSKGVVLSPHAVYVVLDRSVLLVHELDVLRRVLQNVCS